MPQLAMKSHQPFVSVQSFLYLIVYLGAATGEPLFFLFWSDDPLITVDKSPSGSKIGKSTDARIIAASIYQPNRLKVNNNAPPTCCNLVADAT